MRSETGDSLQSRSGDPETVPAEDISLESRYPVIRRATEHLCEPLTAEDAAVQSMRDASPAKWHLAHTSWFFEIFLLEREMPGYRPFHPLFRTLYNSYYNSVGEQYLRPKRGLLTRPSLADVLAYRAHVDRGMLELLSRGSVGPAAAGLIETGLQHEQQHQELILTDLKHLFSCNPLEPVYRRAPDSPDASPKPLAWHAYEGGEGAIGHEGPGFAFDNEMPRHRVFIRPFEMATRAVTNGDFLAFMEAGGYEDPQFWLADGWITVQERDWRAPLYWARCEGEWSVFTLSGRRALRAEEPVCHVSFYEADAFARWVGARLPSEAEWEVAAAEVPRSGNFVESGLLHPSSAVSGGDAPAQLFGDVWEWTRSAYGPYPGYVAPPGPLAEYNGKFMSNQMVLRGGSCATPRSHIRATYRNFFYPDSRWQFGGIRLARDLA